MVLQLKVEITMVKATTSATIAISITSLFVDIHLPVVGIDVTTGSLVVGIIKDGPLARSDNYNSQHYSHSHNHSRSFNHTHNRNLTLSQS